MSYARCRSLSAVLLLLASASCQVLDGTGAAGTSHETISAGSTVSALSPFIGSPGIPGLETEVCSWTTHAARDFDRPYAMALQPDGSLIDVGVAAHGWNSGRCGMQTRNHFAISRFTGTGRIDLMFGSNGRVEADFGTGFDSMAYSAAVQADGKIVAAGWVNLSESFNASCDRGVITSSVIARFLPDGRLDTGFGRNGFILERWLDVGSRVLVQPDGKILVAGTYGDVSGRHFALVRYQSDGSHDPGFINAGVMIEYGLASIQTSFFWDLVDLALQPDGKIVIAGKVGRWDDPSFIALVRYHADGSRDASFGTGGIARGTVSANTISDGMDLLIQPDGKILYSYSHHNVTTNQSDYAIRRYLADGTPDGEFGDHGEVVTEFGCGRGGRPTALALQSDGKIIAAGEYVVRYHPDGALDSSFGAAGKVFIYSHCGDGMAMNASGVAVLADGTILFSSSYTVPPRLTGQYFAAGRLKADGSPDLSFGINSRAISSYVPGAKRVFVTGHVFTGNLGGLAGADAICADAALNAGLGGGAWKAYLSTSTVDAISRIADSGPWYLSDRSTEVFPALATLVSEDGALNAINMTETGWLLSSGKVWSDTIYNGQKASSMTDYSCGDWTSSVWMSSGYSGDLASSITWAATYGAASSCSRPQHLYCFEQ